MARVVWTLQAVDDLESIHSYIARDSEHYASAVVERILDAVGRLEDFPMSGRVLPELEDQAIRELIWGNYRIVHRAAPDLVEVLTVFHGARMFPRPTDTA